MKPLINRRKVKRDTKYIVWFLNVLLLLGFNNDKLANKLVNKIIESRIRKWIN